MNFKIQKSQVLPSKRLAWLNFPVYYTHKY
nr:MAG TPA: hypothetical protein [Caudoviricetes sp.]